MSGFGESGNKVTPAPKERRDCGSSLEGPTLPDIVPVFLKAGPRSEEWSNH